MTAAHQQEEVPAVDSVRARALPAQPPGGRFGRGAKPPSEEIECHAHRHKEATL